MACSYFSVPVLGLIGHSTLGGFKDTHSGSTSEILSGSFSRALSKCIVYTVSKATHGIWSATCRWGHINPIGRNLFSNSISTLKSYSIRSDHFMPSHTKYMCSSWSAKISPIGTKQNLLRNIYRPLSSEGRTGRVLAWGLLYFHHLNFIITSFHFFPQIY